MDGLLSRKFLDDIGVKLDEQTYQALSEHYEETLNERVISEIVDELNEGQLKELEALKAADEGLLQEWLAVNVPQLNEIIEDEITVLLGELAESSDQLT